MGRLISLTTTAADGLSDVGGWFVREGPHMDAALQMWDDSAGMLVGRTTFEGLAGFWSQETGPWADMLNPLPKWVISRTLEGPQQWNGTAIAGEAAETVAKLKNEVDGDIVMTGCGELASELINAGLVDEVLLSVHPALGGAGNRPYPDAAGLTMRLIESTSFDSGVTTLRYEPLPRAEA